MRWKNAAVLALAVMAVGCSSNSKKELPPNELPDIQEEVRLDAQWSRSIGDGQGELYNLLTPAVDGERLYAAAVNGEVVALDRLTGDKFWEVELDLPVSGGVGAGYGLVLVGTLKGEVIALDASNGEEKWRARVTSEVLSAPATNGDVVVVQTQDDRLIAFDASTGEQRWIYENSPVTHWQSGSLRTDKVQVRSRWIVPAVEGYSVTLPPLGRYQLPVQSLLVATEPLSAATWDEIGLSRGQAFSESSRQVTYGQRTADNRLVFGARGGYQFAGKLRHNFDLTTHEVELRRYLFGELFPQLKNVRITHGWGGNLGMSRRFKPHMLCDRSSGIALSGGYGGEGVGASNLGGRTLADLILERDTELVRQPWVIPHAGLAALRAWEPEPCRWLGYNAIIRSFVHEDQTLANPTSAPWRRKLASGVAGFMEGFMH